MNISTVRQFYAWHKWTGLFAGLFLLFISLTGTVAVFKEEIDRAITPAKVVRPGAEKRPLDEVLANVKRSYPGVRISGIALPRRPDAAYTFHASLKKKNFEIFADPYTGKVTGARTGETVANVIRQLHARFYYFGFWGRVANGVFGLLLLISIVTGLLIYWRFMKGIFSRGLHFWSIRKGLQLATSDWHKLIGITAVIFNLLIAVTGAVLGLELLASYSPGIQHALHRAPKPVKSAVASGRVTQQISLEQAFETGVRALPGFVPQMISLPAKRSDVMIWGRGAGALDGGGVSFVIIDLTSGAILDKFDETEGATTHKLYSMVKPLHFGSFAGLWLKVVYVLFSISTAFLSITGFLLWWLKWGKRRPAKPRRYAPGRLATSEVTVDR